MGQLFQIITSAEITSYKTPQKLDSAAMNPGKHQCGVSGAPNIHIFSLRFVQRAAFGMAQGTIFFYSEAYLTLKALLRVCIRQFIHTSKEQIWIRKCIRISQTNIISIFLSIHLVTAAFCYKVTFKWDY